eukprot:CAMPEP_0170542902 /NCGR_PEP_ID=MMETSP0211-20121228/2188_1 /TAXON_ID=311385 /ORGANISM="Pseudokeronopsis sp., Strain OXSARD2" /LENGTH=105 /DNA_ID=CAMNT_0010846121 /DNA_START=1562 /DNA_END=1879 /DNA_ORIENTATION=-
MSEAKRHFNNYVQVRDSYNKFLESKVGEGQISGGTKGQKIQNDILAMLKKNLESQEKTMKEEKESQVKAYSKLEELLEKKNQKLEKKEKEVTTLKEEIERRQFLE